MTAYSRGRLARRMGFPKPAMFVCVGEYRIKLDLERHGWDDEDDTLRTGVDTIQAAYVADRLAVQRAAEEQRFREWVRLQRVAG